MLFRSPKRIFVKLAGNGNLIPVYSEVVADLDTPISAFSKIDKGGYSFLLESVEGGERLARYSFLGSDPSLVFSTRGKQVTLREGKTTRTFDTDDPIRELKKLLSGYRFVKVPSLPRFTGGLVGFLCYDMVRFIEKLPDKNDDQLEIPDSVFMLADTLLIFDHVDHKIKVVSNAHIKGQPGAAYDEAVRRIRAITEDLKARRKERPAFMIKHKPMPLKLKSNFSEMEFDEAVVRAKKYIKSGDIIQVVLSQRFQTPVGSHPLQIYRALRSINPSPYMYYLKLKDFHIVGSSPEIMVRCEDGTVEVRPIAGTRPRGSSESEDASLAEELLKDPKERA